MQNFVQVMFRPIISADKRYVGCKFTNFITSSGIFQALLVSDRLYVKCQNTSRSVGVNQVCNPYSAQFSCYSFVSITISWLFEKKYTNSIFSCEWWLQSLLRIYKLEVEHESTNDLMWHKYRHY